MVCTQPRRIAAISVAERVCAERGEAGGPGAHGSRVGYHVSGGGAGQARLAGEARGPIAWQLSELPCTLGRPGQARLPLLEAAMSHEVMSHD